MKLTRDQVEAITNAYFYANQSDEDPEKKWSEFSLLVCRINNINNKTLQDYHNQNSYNTRCFYCTYK